MKKQQVTKRRWYRYLIQLMVVALMITSIPMNGLAETAPPFTPSPNSEQSPQVEKEEEKELPAPHPDQVKKKLQSQVKPTEVVEERTETEKIFDNQDGTFTKKVYTEAIHTEKNGKLEEVSSTLVEAPDKKIVTENTKLKPEFKKTVTDGKYVQFKTDDHAIQYELIGASGEKGGVKPSTSFTYNRDLLVSSTTPEGKAYRYGYENELLTHVYDPKHTDEKPYQTIYMYENDRLVKVTDSLGKASTLSYNTGTKEVTVTDPKGRKVVYSYNDAGNPVKTIVDAGRLNLTTTTYEYSANNLVKTTTPKNQTESFTYDNNGNVTSATNAMGTEKFEYNANNGITRATDNEGRETTVAYKAANTEVSETEQAANTSSVTYHDQYGNPIETSKELGTGENL